MILIIFFYFRLTNSLFIFPSHPYPLSAIQWRTAEDYLVLGYSDETAYVWQVKETHMNL